MQASCRLTQLQKALPTSIKLKKFGGRKTKQSMEKQLVSCGTQGQQRTNQIKPLPKAYAEIQQRKPGRPPLFLAICLQRWLPPRTTHNCIRVVSQSIYPFLRASCQHKNNSQSKQHQYGRSDSQSPHCRRSKRLRTYVRTYAALNTTPSSSSNFSFISTRADVDI